jgi:hypothetical protein
MSLLTVNHATVYRYQRPVRFGEHRLMFRPRDSHDLRLVDVSLTISPPAGPAFMTPPRRHAWIQVYLPGAGWVEFDPTNGPIGGANLIRVAVAREPSQAVPLQGTYFGAAADCLDMTVDVRVTRDEPPLPALTPMLPQRHPNVTGP